MANAHFYFMCPYVALENGDKVPGITIEVSAPEGTDYSDHAAPNDPPAPGDPMIGHVLFRASADYVTVLEATCPTLPASASSIFCFAHKATGAGTVEVCNGNMPTNQDFIDKLMAYLQQWYPPSFVTNVEQNAGLTATMTRCQIIDAIAPLINPLVGPVVWS